MVAVAEVSQAFVLALCLMLAPADQGEVRLDALSDAGYMDTLVAVRTAQGWELYDEVGESDDDRVTFCTVERDARKKDVLHVIWEQRRERVDLGELKRVLKPLASNRHQRLSVSGRDVRIDASGKVVYVNVKGGRGTFAVH